MLILTGIVSGILTGITGIQIGVLIPALLLFELVPNIETAVGTVLYVFLPPTAALSVYYLWKKKRVDTEKGNVLMITLLFSVLLGAWISQHLSRSMIYLISSLLCFGLFLFYLHLFKKSVRV
jgi:uncharacterized membrane protein YfcA